MATGIGDPYRDFLVIREAGALTTCPPPSTHTHKPLVNEEPIYEDKQCSMLL